VIDRATAEGIYEAVYANEPCVAVLHGALPSLKDVVYRNRVAIGVAPVANVRRPRLTVIAAIDNLVKGAAGQAIQNMNVMLVSRRRRAHVLSTRVVKLGGNELDRPAWLAACARALVRLDPSWWCTAAGAPSAPCLAGSGCRSRSAMGGGSRVRRWRKWSSWSWAVP